MIEQTELIKLGTLGGGAVAERFDLALKEVIDNILDPNTDATKTRSITINFKIKPDENREVCAVVISSETKLVPISELKTHIFVGMEKGQGVACERSMRQANMFTETPLPTNLIPIKKEGTGQ